jgi:hypothetical protein
MKENISSLYKILFLMRMNTNLQVIICHCTIFFCIFGVTIIYAQAYSFKRVLVSVLIDTIKVKSNQISQHKEVL